MKHPLYAALLLLVQPLSGCSDTPQQGDATAPVQTSEARDTAKAVDAQYDTLVVAFGDSLYAGYGLSQDEGFAPQLQDALAERGLSVRVVNAGVSGDTTAAGRGRLAFTLDGLDHTPDLVIVGLGGNDMLRGIGPDQTRANLTAILDELKAREIPAMLTGMVAAPNMGADYADAFNAIYPDLAKQYDVPLYPFFLDGVIEERTLMLADGLHPKAEGVEAIVEKVAPLVAGAIRGQ